MDHCSVLKFRRVGVYGKRYNEEANDNLVTTAKLCEIKSGG